jgi:hypothetical protein
VFEDKFSTFVGLQGSTHNNINTYVTAEREEMYLKYVMRIFKKFRLNKAKYYELGQI